MHETTNMPDYTKRQRNKHFECFIVLDGTFNKYYIKFAINLKVILLLLCVKQLRVGLQYPLQNFLDISHLINIYTPFFSRHEFHKNCIDPWLLEHQTCPMCKMDILKHYGFVVSVSIYPSSYNY